MASQILLSVNFKEILKQVCKRQLSNKFKNTDTKIITSQANFLDKNPPPLFFIYIYIYIYIKSVDFP